MEHQPGHPLRNLVDRTCAPSKAPQNIAILSPWVQLSFVFHLAISQLERHIDETPNCVVTVIGSSQAVFQKMLIEENDGFLMRGSSSDALAKLLGRIEFRFCSDLAQLLSLLCDLGHPTAGTSAPSHEDLGASCPRIALIIADLTSYLIAISTQSQIASISRTKHPPPVYILDRIEPTEKWRLSPTTDPEDVRSILEVFQHFFHHTWNIERLESDKRTSNNTERYRMYSSSASNSPQAQIVYEVLEEEEPDEYPANPAGVLRKTVTIDKVLGTAHKRSRSQLLGPFAGPQKKLGNGARSVRKGPNAGRDDDRTEDTLLPPRHSFMNSAEECRLHLIGL
ncbi:hypothetical protein PtB15_14B33 [Puccinia triticina]|nr:hypothetical protein PtB15_14B33 [Puccinia triticina]